MYEDVYMNSVLLARNSIETLEQFDISWFNHESPMAHTEDDVPALRLLEHMLLINEHDIMSVITNLDDAVSWSLVMAALPDVAYLPLVSQNHEDDWHMTPHDIQDFLASVGVEAEMIEVHQCAMLAIYWAVFVSRIISGVISEEMSKIADEEE